MISNLPGTTFDNVIFSVIGNPDDPTSPTCPGEDVNTSRNSGIGKINDLIVAVNDQLGGDNSNLIRSGLGNDYIYAGIGHDTIFAGAGDDYVDGGGDVDTIFTQPKLMI